MEINKSLVDTASLKSVWSCGTESSDDAAFTVHQLPFRLMQARNLVSAQDVASVFNELRSEIADKLAMSGEATKNRSNDLFSFTQSADLANLDEKAYPSLCKFRSFIKGELRDWVRDVTGFSVTDNVAMTVSRYGYNDVLLPHDDRLQGRKVAYVLYLTSQPEPSSGGDLLMFESDDFQPTESVRSLAPAENTLVMFEVSRRSWHQVAEVTDPSFERLSINGWFHVDDTGNENGVDACKVVMPTLHTPGDVEYDTFIHWVNPLYLAEEMQSQIREQFGDNSEIQLQAFIQEEQYNKLVECLFNQNPKSIWSSVGPLNKRRYRCLSDEATTIDLIREWQQVFASDAMYLLLSQLTGLSLHPMAPDEESTSGSESEDADKQPDEKRKRTDNGDQQCGSKSDTSTTVTNKQHHIETRSYRHWMQIRRFGHGDYTLMNDEKMTVSERLGDALDMQMFVLNQDTEWNESAGGYSSYVAGGDPDNDQSDYEGDGGEELLTIVPKSNSLALVFREPGTLRFVRYINDKVNQIKCPQFIDLSATYYSQPVRDE